jgi:hypothetical protein
MRALFTAPDVDDEYADEQPAIRTPPRGRPYKYPQPIPT